MKWTHIQPTYPQYGDKRIAEEDFLLWPMTIDNETRWLEWVVYEEEYAMGNFYDGEDDSWVPVRWID